MVSLACACANVYQSQMLLNVLCYMNSLLLLDSKTSHLIGRNNVSRPMKRLDLEFEIKNTVEPS